MKIHPGKIILLLLPVLLLTLTAYSQPPVKNYSHEWKTVDQFLAKRLPKSALGQVKKIYQLARRDQQEAQQVKCLVVMAGLQAEFRDDSELMAIKDMETELTKAGEPMRSILSSLLAHWYHSYFQQNRWKIYQRTRTENFSKADIATWGVSDFHQRISWLYLQSLREEKLLQQTKLDQWNAIIRKGNMRKLRPTLFDLLAFRALEYFEDDEKDLSKPAYAFEISQAAAFDPAADFLLRKFPTRDSQSLQHKALLVYQQLIAFHLKDRQPDALLDADLARLRFVHQHSTHPDKDAIYFDALLHIAEQYNQHPAAAQAWYLVASHYRQKGAEYKPYGDSTHRLSLLQAKKICETVLQQKDSSEGKINCFNLLNEINGRNLEFRLEKVNLPDQPFRVQLQYRNLNRVYFRLLRADDRLLKTLENPYEQNFWPTLVSTPSLREWQQPLPDPGDLQEHKAEVKVDGLGVGEYVLVAASEPDFRSGKALLGARLFYVSNISLVKKGPQLAVLHRNSGQPLDQASVQVWEMQYDYKEYRNVKQKRKKYITDENGFVRLEPEKTTDGYTRNQGKLFDISWKEDRLFLQDALSDPYYNSEPDPSQNKTQYALFLFADRAIYRPGQTFYFKGILLQDDGSGRKNKVAPGQTVSLQLLDAGDQEITKLSLSTNAYGSFNGRITLPANRLTGSYSLYSESPSSVLSFRVEEYKRPKFYVEYAPLEGTYKVNDSILVNGRAKGYAGNNIDGASVRYRVVRQPRFPYPWLFWRWWQPPSEAMEITHGEAQTDKEGRFSILFSAIPDRKIDPKFEPVFDYTVYADVTDINGETRSGEVSLPVSYKSLILVSNLPERMSADSFNRLSLRTQNLNGVFEPASLQVTILPLQPEQRLIRSRYWDRPDQFVMSRAEYTGFFPHDEYDNETDQHEWTAGAAILEKTDTARPDGHWPLEKKSWRPGHYRVEISARNRKGEEVKERKYLELYDAGNRQLHTPRYLWTNALQTLVQPGDSARVELGSSAKDLFVIQETEKSKEGPDSAQSIRFLRLSAEKKELRFPVTKEDLGGFGLNWLFVKNNRLYEWEQRINVPWDRKQLQLEYLSFRDKSEPGSGEKWKLRVSGWQQEKVAAEMLATLYDASLDQFTPHDWTSPQVWPSFYGHQSWEGRFNFQDIRSQQRYLPYMEQKPVVKEYDELFGGLFGYNGYGGGREVYMMMKTADGAPPRAESEEAAVADSASTRDMVERKDEDRDGKADPADTEKKKVEKTETGVAVRRNFNETAFFFPELRTDSTGAVEFSFTLPESLTRWKFMALAHTTDAAFGYSSREMITQKELMVQPNAPRFLREGDRMEFSAKIVNLREREITGTATLQLFDAASNQPVDGWFGNRAPLQYFTVAPGQSEAVQFPIDVPYQFNKALTWRIIARSSPVDGETTLADGEENNLPVLTNRMLVTESLTLPMKGSGTRSFPFEKLKNSGRSNTLQHHALTVEYTSNPAWYAVQALPYLMEFPYECAEQTWNRYYANAVAQHITGSTPRIRQVFEKWKTEDTAALLSNLQKNPELKNILLEETPWVLQASKESEQKRNIALLFDLVKMSEEKESNLRKLLQMQSPNGGFVWFAGGPDDRYITQYIVTGIGHLKKLGALDKESEKQLGEMLRTALSYLDRKMKEEYDLLKKTKTNLLQYIPGYTEIQYLYLRSFFPLVPLKNEHKAAYQYFLDRLPKTWTRQSRYMQGMTALTLHRRGDTRTAAAILKSLRETAVVSEEMGMYYREQRSGWFWYEAPVETQSLLIEAFMEAGKDLKTADLLRTWLLRNKQTNNWKTTKATAEACYALLLQGSNWLSQEPAVDIQLGSNFRMQSGDKNQEAGTGYMKNTIEGNRVNAGMGDITVRVTHSDTTTAGASWGAVYWQYFEDLDQISQAATPLRLNKKLFVEHNSSRGPVIRPVNEGDALKVGDKVKVRLELRVDRDMEYVHLKDMRAAGLEPVNVLSRYQWQGGLGYYESTKDAASHFFISFLRKGTYVFEYSLFATQAGQFSNGISQIQCMYAPEFSAHSEGIRIRIE